MPVIELETGRIHYEEVGPPDGRPVVFVHGFMMGSSLWGDVARQLAARGLRCIAPTWPMGAHPEPMRPGADLTPRGVAGIVAEFLTTLELDDVVLVGNDSGGAIAQVVAVDHPERLGALVLTNCDTYEHFPPSFFKLLVLAAKLPGASRVALAPMRTAAARRSPLGFGLLSHADVDHLAREWVRPAFEVKGVMDDLRRFTMSIDSEVTIDAAARLPGFGKPVLLAWGTDDRLFPPAHAERLARDLPAARLELIPDSRTYVMIDQPARLAELIAEVPAPVAGSRP